jgi:capsid protein
MAKAIPGVFAVGRGVITPSRVTWLMTTSRISASSVDLCELDGTVLMENCTVQYHHGGSKLYSSSADSLARALAAAPAACRDDSMQEPDRTGGPDARASRRLAVSKHVFDGGVLG